MSKVTIITSKGTESGRIIHTRESGAILFNYAPGLSRWIEAGEFIRTEA